MGSVTPSALAIRLAANTTIKLHQFTRRFVIVGVVVDVESSVGREVVKVEVVSVGTVDVDVGFATFIVVD